MKVALCQAQVPCGETAQKVFDNAKLTVKPVTLGAGRQVGADQVPLGEVDAGVVYVTDVRRPARRSKASRSPPTQRVHRRTRSPRCRARPTRPWRRLSSTTCCPPTAQSGPDRGRLPAAVTRRITIALRASSPIHLSQAQRTRRVGPARPAPGRPPCPAVRHWSPWRSCCCRWSACWSARRGAGWAASFFVGRCRGPAAVAVDARPCDRRLAGPRGAAGVGAGPGQVPRAAAAAGAGHAAAGAAAGGRRGGAAAGVRPRRLRRAVPGPLVRADHPVLAAGGGDGRDLRGDAVPGRHGRGRAALRHQGFEEAAATLGATGDHVPPGHAAADRAGRCGPAPCCAGPGRWASSARRSRSPAASPAGPRRCRSRSTTRWRPTPMRRSRCGWCCWWSRSLSWSRCGTAGCAAARAVTRRASGPRRSDWRPRSCRRGLHASTSRSTVAARAGARRCSGPTVPGKSTRCGRWPGWPPWPTGRITLGGATLGRRGAGLFVEPPARRSGYVFQDYRLFPHLSVLDNVAFALRARGRAGRPRSRRPPAGSTGSTWPTWPPQAGRSCPAAKRSGWPWPARWSADPALLLLDEPLSALDARTRLDVQSELRRTWRPSRSVPAGHPRPARSPGARGPAAGPRGRPDRAGGPPRPGRPAAGNRLRGPASRAEPVRAGTPPTEPPSSSPAGGRFARRREPGRQGKVLVAVRPSSVLVRDRAAARHQRPEHLAGGRSPGWRCCPTGSASTCAACRRPSWT